MDVLVSVADFVDVDVGAAVVVVGNAVVDATIYIKFIGDCAIMLKPSSFFGLNSIH